MSDTIKRATVRIELNRMGHGKVLVNDVDMSRYISEMHIALAAGEPSQVTLTLIPTVVEVTLTDTDVTLEASTITRVKP